MKLEVKALIRGDFAIQAPLSVKCNGYEVDLCNENGNYFISVIKPVENYAEYITKYDEATKTFILTKHVIYQDMIEYLQYIESIGAFDISIDKINWQEAIISWIPETDSEKGVMPILSHQRKYRKNDKHKLITTNNLQNLVIYKSVLKNIYIPFSYYRVGKNYFMNHMYYFAYIQFYMMIEYCFANGKFRTTSVLKEYKKSSLLRKAIHNTINNLKTTEQHENWFKSECKKYKQDCDIDGMTYILVEYRGLLSHASKLSESYLFNDDKLFSIALIANLVCNYICGYLEIGCFTNDEGRSKLYSINNGEK